MEKERWAAPYVSSLSDNGYGLFWVVFGFLLLVVMGILFRFGENPVWLESVLDDFKFARRFIQFEKGRRRPWRSIQCQLHDEEIVVAFVVFVHEVSVKTLDNVP